MAKIDLNYLHPSKPIRAINISLLFFLAVDVMKLGTTVELRNAKIDMFKGSMRLAVDKWGIVKAAESPAEFAVKEDNNLSLIEFELVTVVE